MTDLRNILRSEADYPAPRNPIDPGMAVAIFTGVGVHVGCIVSIVACWLYADWFVALPITAVYFGMVTSR